MQFYKSFKLEHEIYFLVEYVCGQSLYQVIRDIGLLSSYDA
jgi:cGMP-dependent protein kinase